MPVSMKRAMIVYRRLPIEFIPGGYFCRIPVKDVAIDADGAPNAYGPKRFPTDRHGRGIESLINASFPNGRGNKIREDVWTNILVRDPDNPTEPLIKNGYYISKTSLNNEGVDDQTDGKYVDAATVSYIVMPEFWIDNLGVEVGDLTLLWHSRIKTTAVAIVADTCPADEPLGEMSIAAAKAIGGQNISPRTGADFPANGSIHCYIFKNSRRPLR